MDNKEEEQQLKELRDFIHDISGDVSVVDGFMRHGMAEVFEENNSTHGKELLDKGYGKILGLSQKIREFRERNR